ncbi:MAG: hypothetical protein C4289_09315 [Chloroflexota bacterium]
MTDATVVQCIRDTAEHLSRVPFLGQHHQELASRHCRSGDFVEEEVREGVVEIVQLGVLASVNALRVVLADPLAPAVQHQPPVQTLLSPWQMRVSDKDQVRGEALGRQGLRQFGDALTKPAST